MINITFAIHFELKEEFVKKCGPIAYSKILRGLIRAFVDGRISLKDLDLA